MQSILYSNVNEQATKDTHETQDPDVELRRPNEIICLFFHLDKVENQGW